MKAALLLSSLAGFLAMTAPTAALAQLSLAALASVQPLETAGSRPAAASASSAPALPGADGYFLSSISETFGNSAGSVFVRRSHGIVFPALTATNTTFDLNLAYLTGSISEIERTLVAHSAAISDFFKAGRPWNPGVVNFPETSRAGRIGVVVWNLDNGLGSTPTSGWYDSLAGPNASFLPADVAVGDKIFAMDVSLARMALQNAEPAPIPEPSTYALILGLAALACAAHRRWALRSV